jgi:hypothetical protein
LGDDGAGRPKEGGAWLISSQATEPEGPGFPHFNDVGVAGKLVYLGVNGTHPVSRRAFDGVRSVASSVVTVLSRPMGFR